MPVPNTFANATATIPLSQLDANFATTITLGNTAIQLGNTVSTLNNMTLANVTVTSGNVTITNVTVTTANVTTANISTEIVTTSQTLNYGTANGVVYLNASKVSTTGTALVFDGNKLTISSSGEQLKFTSSGDFSTTGQGYLRFYDSVGAKGYLGYAGTASQMDLQSGAAMNLNINAAGGTLTLATSNTTKATLDSSGNLGLGVTPSAWGSNYRAVEVSGAVNVFGNTGDANFAGIGANLYHNNTNYLYRYSTLATMYLQDNGTHQWHIAPSGTAGNAITFTQAMTLDASGNLILGGTSQLNGALLTVTGNVNAEVTQSILNTNTGASANARLDIGSSNYVNNELTLIAYSDAATGTLFGINKAKLKVIIDNVGVSAANSNGLLVGTGLGNPLYFGTNSTERVRIDASGYTQFSSNLVMPYQGAPTTKNAAATLSGAELVTGLLNTTGTTYTITLPTGTNIEGALTWAGNNVSLDWTVINTASGTITIGANGNTTLGSLTIATGTSAGFRIRRTAANTFTVYRMR